MVVSLYNIYSNVFFCYLTSVKLYIIDILGTFINIITLRFDSHMKSNIIFSHNGGLGIVMFLFLRLYHFGAATEVFINIKCSQCFQGTIMNSSNLILSIN